MADLFTEQPLLLLLLLLFPLSKYLNPWVPKQTLCRRAVTRLQSQTLRYEIHRFRSHNWSSGEAEDCPLNHLIELSAVGCLKGVGSVDELVGEDT
jgi:hypothetical protein